MVFAMANLVPRVGILVCTLFHQRISFPYSGGLFDSAEPFPFLPGGSGYADSLLTLLAEPVEHPGGLQNVLVSQFRRFLNGPRRPVAVGVPDQLVPLFEVSEVAALALDVEVSGVFGQQLLLVEGVMAPPLMLGLTPTWRFPRPCEYCAGCHP